VLLLFFSFLASILLPWWQVEQGATNGPHTVSASTSDVDTISATRHSEQQGIVSEKKTNKRTENVEDLPVQRENKVF
jgi:hypothetical protein